MLLQHEARRRPPPWNRVRAGLLIVAGVVASARGSFATRALAQDRAESGEVVRQVDLPVSRIHAGSAAAEVQRILGRPTVATDLGAPESGDAALVYANEPVRARVVLSAGKVSSIALDVVYIDPSPLPMRARMIKAAMRRDGVTALLGVPDADQGWTEAGRDIEQLTYADTDREFSVFLADGLVVDVRTGHQTPGGIASMLLPTSVADAVVGDQLAIGLSSTQASSLLGALDSSVRFALKGEPVEYATYRERDDSGLVSVVFAAGLLTAFTIWPPDAL
jgi:hypothetical protein